MVHAPSMALGFVVAVVATALAWACHVLLHGRRRRMEIAADASSVSAENIKRIFKDTSGLPFWIQNPESLNSNVEFCNVALKLLWARIDRAGSEWAFTDRRLEKLMNAETFWKPQWMRATGIVLQSMILGHKPPKVQGIKVYQHRSQSSSGGIVMDIAFSWNSKMEVKIAMKTLDSVDSMSLVDRVLACVYRSVTVSAVVRNLIARGRIRVTMSPLLDSVPVVGGVHISFLEPPAISYDVTSLGTNPMLLPGLESWLRSFVEDVVLDPFTFPDGVSIDVTKLLGGEGLGDVQHKMPEGILCVSVISATGIPKTDFFGLSDPYITLFVEHSKKQNTTVKSNTLSPTWGEEFDFLVYDAEHQRLQMHLFDNESIGADPLIGTAAIPLNDIEWENRTAEVIVPVDIVFGNGKRRQRRRKHRQRTITYTRSMSASSYGSEQGDEANSVFMYARDVKKPSSGNREQLMDVLKGLKGPRQCMVSLKLEYLPFEQGPRDGGEGIVSGTTELSTRAQRFLRGGMLHVHVNRALNLQSSAQLTKKFKIVLTVLRGNEEVLSKQSEKSGLRKQLNSVNPVFDANIDVLLDSETARDANTTIEVEIVADHFVRRSSSRGKATVDMPSIVKAGRMQGRFDLYKGDERGTGVLEMSFQWTPTIQ